VCARAQKTSGARARRLFGLVLKYGASALQHTGLQIAREENKRWKNCARARRKKGVKASRRTQPACYSFNDRISSPCVCALAERKTFCTAVFFLYTPFYARNYFLRPGWSARGKYAFSREKSLEPSPVKLTLSPFLAPLAIIFPHDDSS
jgi:hypothetical protein